MKFRIIQVTKYRGCRVYLRNIENAFEYLAIVRGEIYAAHVIIKKRFFQKEYTKLQFEKATKMISKMAEATIDSVLDK
jgi:hypothetical protein